MSEEGARHLQALQQQVKSLQIQNEDVIRGQQELMAQNTKLQRAYSRLRQAVERAASNPELRSEMELALAEARGFIV